MEEIVTPLEASDPLSLLIHNTPMEESADWSSLSALWPDDCIEPSALSLPAFDPDSFDLSADMLAAQFLNESAMLIEPVDIKPRRLSVTSSSSDSTGSGPTFSPLPESPGYTSDSSQDSGAVVDPAIELAQRVRQLAGVMFAVPTSGVPQSAELLPAPVSAPPPSTPPLSDISAVPAVPVANPIIPTSIVNLTNSARPKTSHTTIERRYRTNLNARIQSLRMAVPALRVLEDKDSGKKIKKNLKGGVIIKSSSSPIPTTIAGSPTPSNPYGEVDIIDERGYVDGVKVARKCSKANVLGKAVEYIRVLKRRELRLKNEQEGLKSLICGLVGGPALLREWEKEWRLRFGGEEKDEVGGDLNAPGGGELDDDDEEDEMDDDDDGEEGAGKKRKRAKLDVKKEPQQKTTPVIQNVVLGVDGQPEKRKRGRPRKVPLPPSPTVTEQQQPQPQQYLLAVFALFSFFNSPLTTNNVPHQPHSHQGHVVNSAPFAYSEIVSQFTSPSPPLSTWRDWIQVLHLGVTVLLFVSVVVRMVGGRFKGSKGEGAQKNIEEIILGKQSVPSLTSSIKLYHSTRCSPIMKALFLYTLASSSSEFINRIIKSWARSVWNNTTTTTTTKKELVVLSVGLDQIYDGFMLGVKSEIAKMRNQMDDLDDDEGELVINILVRRVIEMKSSKVLGKTFVREVMGGDEKKEESEKKEGVPGIRGEELKLMSEASKELGGQVEVLVRNVEKVVLGEVNGLMSDDDDDDVVLEWKKIDDNLDEGDDSDSMLSSSTISNSTVTSTSVSSEDEEEDEDGHHPSTPFTILQALVLYRSIFSSKTTNPLVPPKISVEPPTPTTPKPVLRRLNTLTAVQRQRQVQEAEEDEKRRRQMYALRRLLGSRVFEKCDQRDEGIDDGLEGDGDITTMEDARDRIVDMLVDAERGRRMNY